MVSIAEEWITTRNEGNWELATTYMAENIVWSTPTGSVSGRDSWLEISQNSELVFHEDVKNIRAEGNIVFVEMVVTGPDFVSPATSEIEFDQEGLISRYSVFAP